MKKSVFLLVLLVPVLVMGLVGCGDGNGGGGASVANSTWSGTIMAMPTTMTFTATNYTMSMKGLEVESGTYTTSGNRVILTPNHTHDASCEPDCDDGDVWEVTVSGNTMSFGEAGSLTRQ